MEPSSDPETLLVQKEEYNRLKLYFENLSPLERTILEQHLGVFDKGDNSTPKELAAKYELSTSRIYVIEQRALQKLQKAYLKYCTFECLKLPTTKDLTSLDAM